MAITDRSGTITTGGAAQVLMAANVARNSFSVQNNSAVELWVNELGATALASQPSIKIAPGVTYESPYGMMPVFAISIFGVVTGQAFSAREWQW